MEKIKIFLSSRVNASFVNGITDYSLKSLREFLKKELQEEKVLGKQCFEVVINEDSFKGTFSQDWFEQCLREMRESHIIVILYNSDAGWSEARSQTNGICHEEFILAVSEFSKLTYAINLSKYFNITGSKERLKKNKSFVDSVNENNVFLETIEAKTSSQLEKKVLKQVRQKVYRMMADSIQTQKTQSISSNTFDSTLDWSKLNYAERIHELTNILIEKFDKESALKGLIKSYHAIPDHMSVADARNRIQRPFLEEHDIIHEARYKGLKKGVVHFVGVYGSATEIQAKNLVGYPDLTVIMAPFGFYLWDKVRHIQIFFLRKCINPETVGTRLMQVKNWLSASRELKNIIDRATARYQINQKISEMQRYA